MVDTTQKTSTRTDTIAKHRISLTHIAVLLATGFLGLNFKASLQKIDRADMYNVWPAHSGDVTRTTTSNMDVGLRGRS